MIGIRLDLNYF